MRAVVHPDPPLRMQRTRRWIMANAKRRAFELVVGFVCGCCSGASCSSALRCARLAAASAAALAASRRCRWRSARSSASCSARLRASSESPPPRWRGGLRSPLAAPLLGPARENHSLIQIQTYASFLLCPSSVLFIFTLHLCVCLPALLTCSGALRTRPSAGRGTRLVRTGTALASAAIARPDQRRRLRWREKRHLSPSGRWIF